ncbi:MAG: DUF302 domain-containing protein, partial [Bryobacteraceae bacterium]
MIPVEALMLEVHSAHPLSEVEASLVRAVQRHHASVHHLTRHAPSGAVVYSLSLPDLSSTLLEADIRFAAFLPLQVAAWSEEGGVRLETISPLDACRLLNRPDLEP